MESHLSVLRRVGEVLLIFCGFHAFALVGDLFACQPHAFSIDALTGVLGLLLARGSLGAARVAAFAHALTLTCAAGAVAALVVVMALNLGPRFAVPADAHELLLVMWGVAWWTANLVLSLWVVLQLRAPSVEAALSRTRRGSAKNSTRLGAGLGLALALLAVPLALHLGRVQAGIAPKAFAAAEQRLGPGWHLRLQRATTAVSGHWAARVQAQRGDDVRELDVGDNSD